MLCVCVRACVCVCVRACAQALSCALELVVGIWPRLSTGGKTVELKSSTCGLGAGQS